MKSRNDGFTSDKEYTEYLRTYFAAMALTGLCAGAKQVPDDNPEQALAKCAIELADAVIEQLNKQP